MTDTDDLEIFLVAQPGLEPVLADEARAAGFDRPRAVPGGVVTQGGWPEVWRANLELRGAGRVLVRVGSFMALHLAQLDKRARRFPWGDVLRADIPVRVEATCRKSRIYHAGAAAQRIERAIAEELGAPVAADAEIVVKVRIEDDRVTLSIDSSGEALHKRGHKQAVGKAPMRETLAALFLRACEYRPGELLVDPMCGSGTFVIEAAEIAAGLTPGRSRGFAFERLASFDPAAWQRMRDARRPAAAPPEGLLHGYDRDSGAIAASQANAVRAGVATLVSFARQPVADLIPPDGPAGLVMVNPPYGARIGNKKLLFGLYGALGQVLTQRFQGWRVGLVTSEASLARASGLPLLPPGPPVAHGGLKVTLWRTAPLGGRG